MQASPCCIRRCSRAPRRDASRCCRCSSGPAGLAAWGGSTTRAGGRTWARRSGWPSSTLNSRACEHEGLMSTLKGIQVVTEPAAPFGTSARSGEKYRTAQGFTAIRDGQKAREGAPAVPLTGKPRWLRALPATGGRYVETRRIVHQHRLATVCEEAK